MFTMISKVLSYPLVFEAQQKICNNYGNVGIEFSDFLKSGQDILDVGCSTGTCAGTIIDMDRNRYTGIDLAPAYIALASKRLRAASFLTMDARMMSFPDNSFDIAMYIGVLHHMDDDTARACLTETRRVLRKDGHVLIAEPVFTRNKWVSTLLLSMDRGKHIRNESGYRSLFGDLRIVRERNFPLSLHRFCSFVLAPE